MASTISSASGADFVALLGFCPLHCALGIAFGLGLRSDRVPLSGLLGRAVVSGLLSSDGILHGRCLRAHRTSLFGALQLRFSRGGTGLRGLGIGDGLDAVGLFALLGLGLLELPLGGQRIVAGHGAGNCYSATSMDAFRPPGGERDGLTIHDTMGVLDRHLADFVDRKALRPLILALPDRKRTILALRFFEEKTQSQCPMSQMHMSRLLARIMAQLRCELLTP